jgi:hypothetical protein
MNAMFTISHSIQSFRGQLETFAPASSVAAWVASYRRGRQQRRHEAWLRSLEPQIRADLGFETFSTAHSSRFVSQADALSSAMFALGSTRPR